MAPVEGVSSVPTFSSTPPETSAGPEIDLPLLTVPGAAPAATLVADDQSPGSTDSADPDSVGFIYDDFPGYLAGQDSSGLAMSQTAAGPDHIVQVVEDMLLVFTKSGDVAAFADLRTFFLVPETDVIHGSPEIVYDAGSGRWIAVSMASNENEATPVGTLRVAVSTTSDPMDGWSYYGFGLSGAVPVWPQVGYSSDKVIVAFDRWQGPLSTQTFIGGQLLVLDKAPLLIGGSAVWGLTTAAPAIWGSVPAQNLSAGGAAFVSDLATGTHLRVTTVTGTFAGANIAIATATYVAPHGAATAMEQLGGPDFSAGGGSLESSVWRGGKLWAAATSGCLFGETLRSCLHLLSIDTTMSALTENILYGSAGAYYYSPSVAIDTGGNLHVAMSRSGATFYPETVITGKLASDPPGTLVGAVLISEGAAPFFGWRWGATSVAIDPSDPSVAWFSGPFGAPFGGPNWGTWIAAGSHVSPSITGLLRITTNPPARTTIIIDGIPRDQWGLNWTKLPPGEYFLEFSDIPEYITPAGQWFTIVAGQTTTIQGEFIHMGQLRVITDPPAPSTIYVDGHPRNDWGMWMWVAPGFYQVCFGDVPGWVAAECQWVEVASGGYTEVVGEFEPEP